MTICVLWYRPNFDEVWCAADTRISNEEVVATDSGPKVLSIPVVCHRMKKRAQWTPLRRFTFGFAFAGSTLTAVNTHALAVSCTQSLAISAGDDPGPPAVSEVAELFRRAAEHCIADVSGRMLGTQTPEEQYFFHAFIYGFCPKERSYKAFGIAPNTTSGSLKVLLAEADLAPYRYHPIGSGTAEFDRVMDEVAHTNTKPGVIPALRKLLEEERRKDVGGDLQLGIARKSGFSLCPISHLTDDKAFDTSFLGWSVDGRSPFAGYRIGYEAFSPHREFD